MRIIYRDAGGIPFNPHISSSAKGSALTKERESVIIISWGKKPDRVDSTGGFYRSGDGYEVRLSDEAVRRNQEVRAHEGAHLAMLGSAAASPIIYDTVTGPGGETIAVGGRIAVDLSEVPGDPEATLRKAQSIITAANAPANPSAGDLRTASKAYTMARRAQQEMNQHVDIKV